MRRPRESKAINHATPPIRYTEMNPMDDHPGLTPLEHKRIKRIAGKGRGGKTKVEVKVKTEVAHS